MVHVRRLGMEPKPGRGSGVYESGAGHTQFKAGVDVIARIIAAALLVLRVGDTDSDAQAELSDVLNRDRDGQVSSNNGTSFSE